MSVADLSKFFPAEGSKEEIKNTTSRNVLRFKYQEEQSFESRFEEAKKMRTKFPQKVPIIVEKNPKSQVENIDKRKYIFPSEYTTGQLMTVIRERLKLKPEEALFLFLGDNTLPMMSQTLGAVYNAHKDTDGFLYVMYSAESTFGY